MGYVTTTVRLEPELARRLTLYLRAEEDAGRRVYAAEVIRRALEEYMDRAMSPPSRPEE